MPFFSLTCSLSSPLLLLLLLNLLLLFLLRGGGGAQRHTLLFDREHTDFFLDKLVYHIRLANQYCEGVELPTITVFGLGTDLIATPNLKGISVNLTRVHNATLNWWQRTFKRNRADNSERVNCCFSCRNCRLI